MCFICEYNKPPFALLNHIVDTGIVEIGQLRYVCLTKIK